MANSSTSRHSSDDVPQLSCDLCRERKIKCDKLDPCTNCTTAGVTCCTIYRNRLPRGRHARSSGENNARTSGNTTSAGTKKRTSVAATQAANQELRQRIESLENLVQNMNKQHAGEAQALSRTNSSSHFRLSGSPPEMKLPMDLGIVSPRGSISSDVPLQFGTSYSSQSPSAGELAADLQNPYNTLYGSPSHSRPMSADGSLAALGLSLSAPPPEVIPQTFILNNSVLIGRLARVYLTQVDPILKILHRPALERWLIHGESYLHYPERHPTLQALVAAICYVTASSMTEGQTQTVLQTSKSQVVDELCKACEAALFNANLISTEDIAVLQAFVLYLFGKKSFDLSKATWTLVSVAVRIGENLGLHTSTEGETFFEQQMRKRLWLTICLLDYRTALTQKSQPLVRHENMEQALMQIRHINDTDFDPSSGPISNREELTDMTFAYVLFQHQAAGRLLNFGFPQDLKAEQARQQYVQDFEEKAWSVLRFCDPESSLLAWFTWHSTQCHVAIVRTAKTRPLSQLHRSGSCTPSTPVDDFERLRMTLRVLEKTQLMHTDIRGEGFRWYATVPWPMLATSIMECSHCSDLDLVRRSWPVMEWWYRHHEALVATTGNDPSQGVLARTMQQAAATIAPILQMQPLSGIDPTAMDAVFSSPPAMAGFTTYADISPNYYTHTSSKSSVSDTVSELNMQMFDPIWLADTHMGGNDPNVMVAPGMDLVHPFSQAELYPSDTY